MLAACAALGAAAQEARWYTQVDNDLFYGTDRWYTSGVRIARLLPRGDHGFEAGVLQEIYTPESKRHDAIDRPPAARLLATFARHDRRPGVWRTWELDAGVTGPSALGKQAQDWIHRYVPAPHEEWKVQRGDRFDGSLVYCESRVLAALAERGARAKANYGAVLGTQVAYAHAGLELRIGRGAALEISSPVLRYAATPPSSLANAPEPGWSAFVAGSVRGVMRNHLLDRQSDSPLAALERYRYVRRFSTGVSWVHPYGILTFAMALDTREFVGQRRDQGFGSLTFDIPL